MRIEVMALHWRLVARNGQVLAHSEQYSRPRDARRAGRSVARRLRLPVLVCG